MAGTFAPDDHELPNPRSSRNSTVMTLTFEKFRRSILVGDTPGVTTLVRHIDPSRIACIVGASIRPQYIEDLQEIAQSLAVPFILQPRRDSRAYDEFIAALLETGADSLVCNSYPMLLPRIVLDVVDGRALNFHASLLPRNRGPNPVQWALIRGEGTTGVTAHLMSGEFDTGPIVVQRRIPISFTDTWLTLMEKVAHATDLLIAELMPALATGPIAAEPQDDTHATKNGRLEPGSPRIDFAAMSDRQIYDLIRAQVHPLAGAFIVDHDENEIRFPEFVPFDRVPTLRARYG